MSREELEKEKRRLVNMLASGEIIIGSFEYKYIVQKLFELEQKIPKDNGSRSTSVLKDYDYLKHISKKPLE